jgi:ribose 5-phosphate isomerase B
MIDTLMHIAIGSDHAGVKLKVYIKQYLIEKGYLLQDFGSFSEESMDYPDSAHPLSKAVQSGVFKYGILICGTGNGMAIVANKYPEIRAAVCWNEAITILARKHNDANILTLPARFISHEEAAKLSFLFITTDFEGGRHERRIEKITKFL